MTHHHIVSVTSSIVVGKAYLSVEGAEDGVSFIQFYVYAVVELPFTKPESGGYTFGNGGEVAPHVDFDGVLHAHQPDAVGIDGFFVPKVVLFGEVIEVHQLAIIEDRCKVVGETGGETVGDEEGAFREYNGDGCKEAWELGWGIGGTTYAEKGGLACNSVDHQGEEQ